MTERQSECRNYTGCEWFTYDHEQDDYFFFDTCLEVDNSFVSCTSYELQCVLQNDTSTTMETPTTTPETPVDFSDYLMVVGGYRSTGHVDTVELDPLSGPSLDCVTPIPYPIKVSGAAGGFLQDKL